VGEAPDLEDKVAVGTAVEHKAVDLTAIIGMVEIGVASAVDKTILGKIQRRWRRVELEVGLGRKKGPPSASNTRIFAMKKPSPHLITFQETAIST
jgi:hypothetical protein